MKAKGLVSRFPITSYFLLTYLISWTGAFLLVAHTLLRGGHIVKMQGILMFPIMLVGPVVSSVLLTYLKDGKNGLNDLFSRMGRRKAGLKWYAFAILLPPLAIFAVLSLLYKYVSPDFRPNFFVLGLAFGISAGFFEEIGWTGYAFPSMNTRYSLLVSSILLGILWGLWHLPVIDFLGAASPHGHYLVPFFLVFCAAMTAMRVIICWVYSNTKSILIAQVMHASSTGFLAMLSPGHVSSAQEVMWYGVYALILWGIVIVVAFGNYEYFTVFPARK